VLKNEAPELFGEAVQALMNNQTWFPEPHAEINEKDSAILQKFNLTPRQGEVLQMMMRGLPNKRSLRNFQYQSLRLKSTSAIF
jgi:DNA-binding NarL/FixJ family response regulator